MSFYINRIKYRGGSPRLGAFSGVINNAYYNGNLFYDTELPTHDYTNDYFTIESLEDNNTITLKIKNNVTHSRLQYIAYSKDNGSTWITTNNSGSGLSVMFSLNTGEKALVKGLGTGWNYVSSSSDYSSGFEHITTTKQYKVYGNMLSLLLEDNFIHTFTLSHEYDYMFSFFFGNSNKLVDASNLKFTLTEGFNNVWDVYSWMFYNCTSLTNGPDLTAPTTLGQSSYRNMFEGCSSLTDVSDLTATTIGPYCYWYMFRGCTSLVKAPKIMATYGYDRCFNYMFNGCSSLREITCLITNPSTSYSPSWTVGVQSTGTFYKSASISNWPSGTSGVPYGWTILDYTG